MSPGVDPSEKVVWCIDPFKCPIVKWNSDFFAYDANDVGTCKWKMIETFKSSIQIV